MNHLRPAFEKIANAFVRELFAAMQHAQIGELALALAAPVAPARKLAPAKQPAARTRRHRASADQVQHQKDIAWSMAKQLNPGFSKGDVMTKSRSRFDLGRALSLLVAEGKLRKRGDRRTTRYFIK